MSITKRIAFGAGASWFSRIVAISLGLILLPVLFRSMPKEELGAWMLLTGSWVALGLLDFGFGVTLTRFIAFATGRSRGSLDEALTPMAMAEIADLLATGRRIYLILSIGVFVVSSAVGYWYLRSLSFEEVDLRNVYLAWVILCLTQAISIWATPWTCLLQGVGYVGWDAILASFVQAVTLLAQIAVVLLGGGIFGLAVVAALGAFAQRFLVFRMARRRRPELFQITGSVRMTLFREMWPSAMRAGFTALGSGIILYSDQILITSMAGAEGLPAYRAAWILVHNLTVLAVTFGIASNVFVSQLWEAGEVGEVHRILERNSRLGFLVMLVGSAVLLFSAEALFSLWLGPGNFVGYPVLIAFLITETLETQSQILSATSRSTGDEAFALASIMAGLLKLALSISLAMRYGLLGVALGTLIALLLTNHWFMPFRAFKTLNFPARKFLVRVVVPCALVLTLLCVALAGIRIWVATFKPIIHVGLMSGVGLIFFVGAAWLIVLEPDHRARIARRFKAISVVS